MPSRAYTSFLQEEQQKKKKTVEADVSMPSRAYTSFLRQISYIAWSRRTLLCQCPLGLIPHFYRPSIPSPSRLILVCQCPLGLIPHFYLAVLIYSSISMMVSMPSRAYTSFLRYHFKSLGFMRFPEPVFAGIYQNILTAAVFRAC